ncbi:hypothetical protein P7K49_014703, partial [Saguinus oedipus]
MKMNQKQKPLINDFGYWETNRSRPMGPSIGALERISRKPESERGLGHWRLLLAPGLRPLWGRPSCPGNTLR